ncbi:MAG: DNA adenine methylase [Pyrinomonadaceae bacterium]
MVAPSLQPALPSPLSTFDRRTARPFLKWVGGKQQLLTQFEPLFPAKFRRYFEPFAGGAAVFFHLWNTRRLPSEAFIFDNNSELINAYLVIRDKVDALILELSVHQKLHSKSYYYKIRGLDRDKTQLSDVQRAARSVYLNRTCYNGLFRVNSKGQFNVPMGSYLSPQVLLEPVIRAASGALQGVTIQLRDFHSILSLSQPGDFFYFDPPYDPLTKTASFTSYTAESFSEDDQRELAKVVTALSEQGAYIMLSNSKTPLILELYERFRINTVQARRAVNSDANGRGRIEEVVVLNY